MILSGDSDAEYLFQSYAESQAGGHHLSENVPFPSNNSAILSVVEMIKAVMLSAAKDEIGSFYKFWNRWDIPSCQNPCKQMAPQWQE